MVIAHANTMSSQYPAQVCKLGMIMYWTRECEQGVYDLRFDRKAMFNTSKRFGGAIGRLPTVLAKGAWKNIDEPMLPVHKTRLETMITVRIGLLVITGCFVGLYLNALFL